jgi:L,D-peptidoglycan transpeptidase YkuD (ErfK/YbiS/YcfS/YnhG family)
MKMLNFPKPRLCEANHVHASVTKNIVIQDNKVIFAAQTFQCAWGSGGIKSAEDKREGDGCTPRGIYPIRRVYYRKDRLEKPICIFPTHILKPNDGWCDDPTDSNYNRFVSLPYSANCERLWREDNRYDIIVEIGHNDDPVVPYKGSAIFLHVVDGNYNPTRGCISLAIDDLLSILEQLTNDSMVIIR